MSENDKINLGDLLKEFPMAAKMLQRESVNNYDDFISFVYDDLDASIRELESIKSHCVDDSEDKLTSTLLLQLKRLGYSASHDSYTNGHVDLTIELKEFSWLGEAKIRTGNSVLKDGLNQLHRRYSTGTPGSDQGGLVIYNKLNRTKDKMESWKVGITEMGLTNLRIENCERNPLAFYSIHEHDATGLDYKIRHIPVSLYYEPIK